MTLAELVTTLATRGAVRVSRVKNLKTSIKYLALALGHASPEQCAAEAACREEANWSTALEDLWRTLESKGRTISAVTRRNTRNDIRKVFTLAAAHGLLEASLPARLLARITRAAFRRTQRETAPYKTTYANQASRRYWLPEAQWPPDVAQGFREYKARCGLRIRERTFEAYAKALMTYLGYLVNICGRTPTWDDLFAVAPLTEFVRWHAARLERSSTVLGRTVAVMIAAMANVIEHPARQALAKFRQGLKAPAPLHVKRNHMLSLKRLEQVADACLAEGRAPLVPSSTYGRCPGALRASRFQHGLILKLLVRVPLRQRNIREMQLGRHLTQDQQTGHWHLEFSGDDLKIGTRGAEVNTYHVDLTAYCKEIIPPLEEFLTVHRCHLPNHAASRFVFLTQRGKPYSANAMHQAISHVVTMRTGQRFYPHLIRTIWATEMLEKTHNYAMVAELLGDTLAVVMKTYYAIDRARQLDIASATLSEVLHTG